MPSKSRVWSILDSATERSSLPDCLKKFTGLCQTTFSISSPENPDTKMTEERMVALMKKFGTDRIIVNSAADWGKSDPLKVPKTAKLMSEAGFSSAEIEKVVWHNPVNFFKQSGKLDLSAAEGKIDQTKLFEGNSVLRGQAPLVQR